MNRRLWVTVAAVVGLLGVGSALTGSGTKLATARDLGARALGSAERASRDMGWPALAGLAVVAGVAVFLTRTRGRRRSGYAEPWRTVIQMGRQGRSPSAIAQATGLPQDAVRIVLAPVQVESFQRGNSFRSAPAGDAAPRFDGPAGPKH